MADLKKEQVDISMLSLAQHSFVVDEAENVALFASAGTGKTFTLRKRIEYHKKNIPKNTCLLAFSKPIQQEWEKYNLGIHCTTSHSLGFRLTRELGCYNAIVDNNKYAEKLNFNELNALNSVRMNFLMNEHSKDFLIEELKKALILNEEKKYRARILFGEWEKGVNNCDKFIDFHDMLCFPLEKFAKDNKTTDNLKTNFDLVIVDEVQDLSLMQIKLIRLIDPKNIWICGDSYQTLYEYAGAKYFYMDKLSKEWDCKRFRLNETRRCPKEIVELAKVFVKDYKSIPSAKIGTIDRESTFPDLSGDTCIISRYNKPLILVALNFLKNNIEFNYKKSVINKLINFIRFRIKSSSENCENALKILQNKYQERVEELQENRLEFSDFEKEYYIISMELLENNKEIKVEELFKQLKQIDKSKGGVTLSTVHSAKGLEWDNVIILDYDGMVNNGYRRKDEAPSNTEFNCCYVALTRSKDKLFFRKTEDLLIDNI